MQGHARIPLRAAIAAGQKPETSPGPNGSRNHSITTIWLRSIAFGTGPALQVQITTAAEHFKPGWSPPGPMKVTERFVWEPRKRAGGSPENHRKALESMSMLINDTTGARTRRGTPTATLRVTHVHGLTLRMAGEIVKALQPLDAEVALEHNGGVANARSILSVVCLAAACGDRVRVWAVGPDCTRAVEVLARAFAGGFGMTCPTGGPTVPSNATGDRDAEKPQRR